MPPVGRELSPGHRVVSASMVPDELACPHCGSKNFQVVGWFKRYYSQPYKDGQPVKDGLTLGAQPVQTIEAIVCEGCQVHTAIEDDEKFERELQIFDLQTENQVLKGKTVISPIKEWKN